MLKTFRTSIFVAFASVLFALPMAAQFRSSVVGEVVDVIDGRTVVVALPTGRVNVQLQFIDVPDAQQELHETVKDHLRQLVLGKTVEYRPRNILLGRTIGLVRANSVDISQQMIRDGAAWHTPIRLTGQEASESDLYASVEDAAKGEKLGIWASPNLKPTWLIAEERLAAETEAKAAVAAKPAVIAVNQPKPKAKPPVGVWADKNPALGNIGALVNGYNAATKRGYVGTPLLAVTFPSKDGPANTSMALDITYLYQETEKKGRQGVFVVNIISVSDEWRFLKNNELIAYVDEKKTVIGKPRRTTTKDGEAVRENLSYTVPRSVLYSFVNGGEVYLKVGNSLIQPAPGLQMVLFNMLQVSE